MSLTPGAPMPSPANRDEGSIGADSAAGVRKKPVAADPAAPRQAGSCSGGTKPNRVFHVGQLSKRLPQMH